ncbi:MAG TPA: hypothetical protein PK403_16415, partial [Plasticicumulans sp.]|nr:hypothetical protein [Plasticicumulans sp.]
MILKRSGDGPGHRLLLHARRVAADRARERAIGAEDGIEFQLPAPGCGSATAERDGLRFGGIAA